MTDQHAIRNATPTSDHARQLHDLGAHFTLCGPPSQNYDERKGCKIPGWESERPALDAVLRAIVEERWIGVVPASLGLVAIDIDEGVPEVVVKQVGDPPLATVRTGRGGTHLLYRAPEGEVRNRKWAFSAASGDIRGYDHSEDGG